MCGMFSWYESCSLVFVESEHTTVQYLDVLVVKVHSAILHFYSAGDGYLMDDNTSKHRARIVRYWFIEHQLDFQQIHWLPQKPNLNLIENLWNMLTHPRAISSSSNLQNHKACEENAWHSLDVNALQDFLIYEYKFPEHRQLSVQGVQY